MNPIVPVILSGGSGTRLWPLSREAYPKQFLPLVGDDTMLQSTWKRVASIATSSPIVIANHEHRFMAAEQLREVGVEPAAVILEPVGRNTAPAIAIAALQAVKAWGDAMLLVLPSDHVVLNENAFHESVREALPAAQSGKLVAFGIRPTAPETGYGYIKAGAGEGVRPIVRFVEKPDKATAEGYVASREYLWNSGMFLFTAKRYLDELRILQPAILAACEKALGKSTVDNDFVRLDAESFEASPDDSIDYAVMEKTKDAAVIALDAGWSDVGSWNALWAVSPKDENGNAHHGDVIDIESKDTYTYGTRLIATVGLKDVVIIETDDAILVGDRHRIQEVKNVVANIKSTGRSEAYAHRKVYRPWGAYDSIDNGPRFQVKRISVRPGASLSLQMHHHRAEHWIVVSGTAEVTRGEEVVLLGENESTYIPLGVVHRLRNPGKLPLELIEVQSGSYLGEDDIQRFEDIYGRTT